MKVNLLFCILLMLNFTGYSQRNLVDYKPFSEWAWGKEDSLEYYLYTPGNLELGKKYPIALHLHGSGATSPHALPHRAYDVPVRMWHDFGANKQKVPTYIISPQTTRGWNQHFESIRKVISFLVEKRQGDPQRIYISGFSMGGGGTFQFISKYPDYFAAAIPIGNSNRNGDFEKIKDIPMWVNGGELDRFSVGQPLFVREIRALNGLALDTAVEWATGINPRFTYLDGLGHLIEWEAASTQDLTGWAYSKINDGNKYPQVFFESPQHREKATNGEPFSVKINAHDPDGTINKIDLYMNKVYQSTIKGEPFTALIKPVSGDNLLEATAHDNKGKTSTATTILVVDNSPVCRISELPYGIEGGYYYYWLPVSGNGTLTFSAKGLPDGLLLLKDGLLKGIPMTKGKFPVEIIIEDEDGDKTTAKVDLNIKEKRANEVLVTNASDAKGNRLEISKMVYGETPNFAKDKEPSSFIEKLNFSSIDGYYGLTFVKSEEGDTTLSSVPYMSFNIDRDAKVLVAYEKLDNLYHTTHPEWLYKLQKVEKPEIVAQFRYFDVYSKKYPKGKVTLPGGEKNKHNVSANYFVMAQPDDFDNSPEINISKLPASSAGTYYSEQLTALYGNGKIKWEITDGKLPAGLDLNADGKIAGIPIASGFFAFSVIAKDEKEQTNQAKINLIVE